MRLLPRQQVITIAASTHTSHAESILWTCDSKGLAFSAKRLHNHNHLAVATSQDPFRMTMQRVKVNATSLLRWVASYSQVSHTSHAESILWTCAHKGLAFSAKRLHNHNHLAGATSQDPFRMTMQRVKVNATSLLRWVASYSQVSHTSHAESILRTCARKEFAFSASTYTSHNA
jgi:hypothetical protein